MLYSEKELKKRLQGGCPLYYFYAAMKRWCARLPARRCTSSGSRTPKRRCWTARRRRWRRSCWRRGPSRFLAVSAWWNCRCSVRRLLGQRLAGTVRHAGRYRKRGFCHDQRDRGKIRQTAPRQTGAKTHRRLREDRLLRTDQQTRPPGTAGACAQLGGGDRRCVRPGAEAELLDRCGDDQFLLQNEIAKLAALSGYGTITGT